MVRRSLYKLGMACNLSWPGGGTAVMRILDLCCCLLDVKEQEVDYVYHDKSKLYIHQSM